MVQRRIYGRRATHISPMALNDAAVDAAALEGLAASITAQANALTARAAPVVTVVPALPKDVPVPGM